MITVRDVIRALLDKDLDSECIIYGDAHNDNYYEVASVQTHEPHDADRMMEIKGHADSMVVLWIGNDVSNGGGGLP
jgi:hypothetical protein